MVVFFINMLVDLKHYPYMELPRVNVKAIVAAPLTKRTFS